MADPFGGRTPCASPPGKRPPSRRQSDWHCSVPQTGVAGWQFWVAGFLGIHRATWLRRVSLGVGEPRPLFQQGATNSAGLSIRAVDRAWMDLPAWESTRYVGGATPGSSVQLRGSPRLTRASTVFLPLLWCFWEEGGLGAWCWLRPPPRVLPFHTSNTRERNANGCNLLLHALHRANRQSNSCVCCWCVVAVPPESPLKIAASFFLGLRPSTCSLRVCSVTPTAILHFQPWGKTRKCKI